MAKKKKVSSTFFDLGGELHVIYKPTAIKKLLEGLVPAHRHVNPDGSDGGWVAETASVAATCTIGKDALVYGNAQVFDNVQVYGESRVYGNARVAGNAKVYGSAEVYGEAVVTGTAWVFDNAKVHGYAQVYGDARVAENAKVYGSAQVYGNAQIYGRAQVLGNAHVSGDAQVSGYAEVFGTARVFGNDHIWGRDREGHFENMGKERPDMSEVSPNSAHLSTEESAMLALDSLRSNIALLVSQYGERLEKINRTFLDPQYPYWEAPELGREREWLERLIRDLRSLPETEDTRRETSSGTQAGRALCPGEREP